MKTYEDFLELTSETEVQDFVRDAINEHKQTSLYKEARIAYDYYRKRNVTITNYQKLLYTMTGQAVPDYYSANYKFVNAFFPIFVKQEAHHLLGEGVTFNNDSTKAKLGGDQFDGVLIKAGISALWGGVSFGFFNFDHVDVFDILEFVPLIGEEDGGMHAGIRFWQVDDSKPLRATLYMEDGYTEYIWVKNVCRILAEKRTYKQIVRTSEVDGTEIIDGENYPNFPIVPLWGNDEHQSELTGLRAKIDGYDLIQSGLANDLDDMAQIYWVLQNTGGMDDIDLVKFIERMKTVRAATVGDEATAEAHTIEIPYQARMTALEDLRDSLYRDAMALDTNKISAGNVTATAIQASYENLTLKCDGFESCIFDFINGLLALINVDDSPTFKRSKIINMNEDTQMVLSSAQYLDDETILNHLPFLNIDEVNDILKRVDEEELDRLTVTNDANEQEVDEEM
jgi:hypothetical protein